MNCKLCKNNKRRKKIDALDKNFKRTKTKIMKLIFSILFYTNVYLFSFFLGANIVV